MTPSMPSGEPLVPYSPSAVEGHQYLPISQRLLMDRVIVLGSFLDEEQANNLIATLLYLQKEDREKKISLYMNIPGALLKPSLAVYDTLKSLKCPITTLNLGLATGMGAFLCGAGTKGYRFALPNARFLLQKTGLDDPYQGQAVDIGLKVADNIADNYRVAAEFAKMTGNPIDKVAKDLERDFYLSAFEAREYGLIDRVLLPEQKYNSDTSRCGLGVFQGSGSGGFAAYGAANSGGGYDMSSIEERGRGGPDGPAAM
eukprot:CAMPEP_0185776242 /NCGR_PEP_ID=MMETSP1174-20130828/84972_1 /TAXON_ID=35687 /ORGANISM="Dictyocha speculum, Strain CCMP1381" /LENGTH=256 /DNA_ID=CAMNT_0028464115 /DNA_START=620 /DNA_END=1390 /DNA_ORIENTATION=-